MKNSSFVGIDLLRFMAAMLVGLFHIAFMTWATGDGLALRVSGQHYSFPEITHISSHGWVGVQIFFMISGFVIMYSAQVSAWTFLRSRILRLYPAVWVCAPLTVFIALVGGGYMLSEVPTRIMRSLLIFPKGLWVDGVYWTLGIEMSFYTCVFAMLALRLKHYIVSLLVVLGVISSSFWIGTYLVERLQFDSFAQIPQLIGVLQRPLELALVLHGCYFAIGGLLWALHDSGRSRWLWVVIGYCVVGAVVEIHHTGISKISESTIAQSTFSPLLIWGVSLALMVASLLYRDALMHLISAAFARKIGQMTYPFYLLHTTVGCSVLAVSGAVGFNRWLALVLALSISVVCSYIVVEHFEPRVKKRLAACLDSVAHVAAKSTGAAALLG